MLIDQFEKHMRNRVRRMGYYRLFQANFFDRLSAEVVEHFCTGGKLFLRGLREPERLYETVKMNFAFVTNINSIVRIAYITYCNNAIFIHRMKFFQPGFNTLFRLAVL